MSGRWRRPESPPHSPPTVELERGCGERRGRRPAPQAPEPLRSLVLRSPFPARIPELGTQPALAHRQPEGGPAALGANEGEARAKHPREARSWVLRPHAPARAAPATSAQRPLSAPLRPSSLPPGKHSLARAAPSRPLPPKSKEVQLLPARRLAAAAGTCGESMARRGTESSAGGRLPGARGHPAPCAVPLPELGDKRAGPHPSTPLYLVRPATLRGRSVQTASGQASSSHRCQPSRAAGVPLGPFAPACDVPPPPTPLPPLSKVSQLFCLRIFRKVSARSPGVGRQYQARQPGGCPAPPSRGPLRSARPGRRAASSRSPSPERGARSASPPSLLP